MTAGPTSGTRFKGRPDGAGESRCVGFDLAGTLAYRFEAFRPASLFWSFGRLQGGTVPARSASRRRRWSLATGDPASVAGARRAFRTEIEQYAAAGSDVDGAELIFVELLSNVIRHGAGAAGVLLRWCDRCTLLVVTDAGRGFGDRRHAAFPEPLAERGRGLALVAALSGGMRMGNRPAGGAYVCAVLPVRRSLFG
jgi:serine/threonine-protein kinase RsbW